MKTPFRQQVSDYDCVPTTFLNGLSRLFRRSEIPPLVVQRIYLYCLDSISSHQNIGHGTSGFAIQLLGSWLCNYRHKKFRVSSEYCSGEVVHFRQGNKISRCLNSGGVALLRVTRQGGYWHYILGLAVKDGWLDCFDPYPKTSRASKQGQYEFLSEDELQGRNLRINCAWLDIKSNKEQYRLGSDSERECLLLERVPV